MCLLCVEITKKSLNGIDFARNLEEVLQTDPQHADEVFKALTSADPDYLDKLENDLLDKLEDSMFEFVIKP